ncbi:MAG: hypothetical protein KC443_02035 [Anaerolineales bacterium]|nr:hypothetical protein [Anaerolineales bacterium]MCB8968951.1 hypothetical protein [Ardenticatenaceae bacterium]
MQKRSSIVGGLIMIVVGAFFLLLQFSPSLAAQIDFGRQWPLLVVGLGVFFLLGALLGTPPLAVPGSIVSGIGGILYYQNMTGNWASWAYMWALIPGFVGFGTMLMGILERKGRRNIREGARLMMISLVMFALFAAFFNGLGSLGRFWPLLLIALGVWLLWQNRR